ncbi:hypothetical protein QOT17_021820 [Balamuthia mandrillaris]
MGKRRIQSVPQNEDEHTRERCVYQQLQKYASNNEPSGIIERERVMPSASKCFLLFLRSLIIQTNPISEDDGDHFRASKRVVETNSGCSKYSFLLFMNVQRSCNTTKSNVQ